MKPERFARLRAVFDEYENLDTPDAAAAIEAACVGDEELLSQALTMLEVARRETAAGEGPAVAGRSFVERKGEASPPTMEGFTLMRELGRGATGVVYEAEQHRPQRLVAIKLLQHHAQSDRILLRFEREAEILARLQHPNIARVYSSGIDRSAGTPTPFIAMELVRGEPITAWAGSGRAELGAVIETFASVCDAVHDAHRRGVIHRDLKPGNILVEEGGWPKVLDFGIARAVLPLENEPLHTARGELLGTLAYMSPEQAAADADGVDLRTDVYALGAVLHELTLGAPPHDVDHLPLAAALDRVRGASRPDVRHSAPASLSGDLSVILGTALDPDRERRYPSAEALGEDLRRMMRHEPILARAPSMSYQLRKFARRRRAALAAATLAAAGLLAGTVVAAGMAASASVARDAEAEARRTAEAALAEARAARSAAELDRVEAERTLGLLTDALAKAEPGEAGAEYTLRAFLQDVAESLGTEASPSSAASSDGASTRGAAPAEGAERLAALSEAHVRAVIGQSLIGLGAPKEAREHLERAASLRAAELGPLHEDTLDARLLLGIAFMDSGAFDDAGAVFEQSHASAAAALGADHRVTSDARFFLASVRYKRGEFEAAELLMREIVEHARAEHGELNETTSAAMASHALVLQRLGRHDEALPISRRAVEVDSELFGPDHPHTLTSRSNLGLLFLDVGGLERAEEIFRSVLEVRRRVLPDAHRHTAVSHSLLARVLIETERYAEAEPHAIRAYETFERTLGPNHPYTRTSRSILDRLYDAWDRPDGVEPKQAESSIAAHTGHERADRDGAKVLETDRR